MIVDEPAAPAVTAKPADKSPREIRRDAGVSIERVAVASGTTSPTVRLFEANPKDGVKDPRKREALARTYAGLAQAARI